MAAKPQASQTRVGGGGSLLRRQAPLFVGALILIGCVAVGMLALDFYLRDIEVDDGLQKAQTLAHILSDQADKALNSGSLVMSKIAEKVRTERVSTTAGLKAIANDPAIVAIASNRATDNNFISTVSILSPDGNILGPGELRPFSISPSYTRSFSERLQTLPADRTYVSAAFQSDLDGTWQISISKKLINTDGVFIGSVTAALRVPSFTHLFESLALGGHSSLSLFNADGAIVACFPQKEIGLGPELAQSTVYTDHIAQHADGVARLTTATDNVDHIFAVANSPSFPVSAVVGVAMNDIVADWTRQVEWLGAGAAAIVLAILFGCLTLATYNEQLAASREREAVQAQNAIQYKRFNDAMDNIVQGLAMYDANSNLIACNRRYAEMYGLPIKWNDGSLLIPPGSNEIGGKSFGKVSGRPTLEDDGSLLTVHTLTDGRIIAQRRKELPDGGYISTHEDITARRKAEDKVKEMASKDALTGLSNRFEFKQRLEAAMAEVRRGLGKFAVLYLDLDRFKAVNDNLGHPAGDVLLVEVAKRLRAAVRQGDAIARLGGDEFAIIQKVANIPNDVMRLAERLLAALRAPYVIDGDTVEIGASIGISVAPNDSLDPEEIIRNADMALYHSKGDRGSYKFFTASMNEDVRSRRAMEQDLRTAIEEKQFSLNFQPIVSVQTRAVESFEALIRWTHPPRGPMSPADFISLAEENGLIVPIGEWVVQEACRQAAKWPHEIKVAVNVSAVQFRSPKLVPVIVQALAQAGIPGSRLIVEVTESVMIKDADEAIQTLHAIRDMGVSIAMDDFGTGFSSLSYLRRFPFDKIKIDRSFVADICEREEAAAILRAAAGLANALGMESVAEGIETEAQMERAKQEGCHSAQGYLISRPIPAAGVLAFLGLAPEFAPAPAPVSAPVEILPAVATVAARAPAANATLYPFRARETVPAQPEARPRVTTRWAPLKA